MKQFISGYFKEMSNPIRDWFRATERCNISSLNRLKDQVNIEATTTWNMNNEEVSFHHEHTYTRSNEHSFYLIIL